MAHRKSKRNKVEQISISLPCEVLMKVDECARRESQSKRNNKRIWRKACLLF